MWIYISGGFALAEDWLSTLSAQRLTSLLGDAESVPRYAPPLARPLLGQAGGLQPAPLTGSLVLRIWDVEHGACAMLRHSRDGYAGRLAMIDSGDSAGWTPSAFIRHTLKRSTLDYLFITNADQDHISDLDGLWKTGLHIPVWYRNPSVSADTFLQIKQQSGPLTTDAWRYWATLNTHNAPVSEPFDNNMGGITSRAFWNKYPQMTSTNDLSLVVFISFGSFTILFPGDLERAGWLALLCDPQFCQELSKTTILVASHHGRENGYCEEVFNFCRPQAVVMSDKPIVHDTQLMAAVYHSEVVKHHVNGVIVATTRKRRHVLTTRRDGHIQFEVDSAGNFEITTENNG
jgi:beta-lactamase superfamily II metal-dependent hydrolase